MTADNAPSVNHLPAGLHRSDHCAPAYALAATCVQVFSEDNPLAKGMHGTAAEARLRYNLRRIRDDATALLLAWDAPVPWLLDRRPVRVPDVRQAAAEHTERSGHRWAWVTGLSARCHGQGCRLLLLAEAGTVAAEMTRRAQHG